MYINAIYKCAECEQEFDVHQDKYYTCPCGVTKAKTSEYFIDHSGPRPTLVSKEIWYPEADYHPPTPEHQTILDTITQYKEKSDHFYTISHFTESNPDDTTILRKINVSIKAFQNQYASGCNEINFNISFEREKQTEAQLDAQMARMLDIIEYIENENINLKRVDVFTEIGEKFDMHQYEEQVEEYDYTLTF